jgi:RNA 3'-terminal phosphate cyclase (ATP)
VRGGIRGSLQGGAGVIEIDGSAGEGGGQIVRTALALAACTATPVRITRIRAARPKPGLQRQHLLAVRALRELCDAGVRGDVPGSRELEFTPGRTHVGRFGHDIGSAGSTSLVLQTLLPPLLAAPGESQVELTGGTHNRLAPTYEFLRDGFVPLLRRMGAEVTIALDAYGFYPVGGGRLRARVRGGASLRPIHLERRGAVLAVQAEAIIARLPQHIAERQLEVLRARLGLSEAQRLVRRVDSRGPGNVVQVRVDSEHASETCTGFGVRGVPAERVAHGLADEVQQYLAADVPVGAHLADQLLLPLALAGGGSFLTLPPTAHTLTNAKVIEAFLGLTLDAQELAPGCWRLALAPAGRRIA